VNRQILSAASPVGMPKESDFQLAECPMPHPAGGEVLVRELYLSVDPSIRGRLSGLTTFAKSIHTGEVIVGGAVGQVVESNDPRFAPGDIAEGMLGWQEYAVAPAKALRKVDSAGNPSDAMLPAGVSVTSSGVVQGTPQKSGSTDFLVQAQDLALPSTFPSAHC